jgi:hypothetical protein
MLENLIEYNVQYGELLTDPYYINDPELFEIFKMGLPPEESYYYFPKGKEIIDLNHKKPEKNVRRIYINVPFLEIENKWLEKYKEMIASHPENKLPEFWNDGYNLAFIYSTTCKLDKAYQRMITYIKWYNNFFPLNIKPRDHSTQVLDSGFLYVFGRDHQFRPLLICQPYILENCMKKFSDVDIFNASIFICQYITNYMLIPGQIENWIMIVNMEGTSVIGLPDSVKKLINALSDNFIARLYRCYILGLNAFVRIIFKVICLFVEKTTVEKVVIIDNKKDMQNNQDINPENIEQRFGGFAQNCEYDKENSLFPPRMPTTNFLLQNENPEEILITEEEYIEKLNSNNIPLKSRSPYILEKLRKAKSDEEKDENERIKRERAQQRIDDFKTKAYLNINTNWVSSNENFDLDKFKIKTNKFIEKINAFKMKKDIFCKGITEVTESLYSDDGNFE